MAKYARVNYNTIKDVEFMRSHPNLIRKLYSVLSDILMDFRAGNREVGVAGRGISKLPPAEDKRQQKSTWRSAPTPSDGLTGYKGTKRLFF